MATRAQSEVVGVILLTAVIVISVTTIGVFMFQDQQQRIAGEGPDVDIGSELNASNVIITHNGGDSFLFSNLELRLRSDGNERIYDLGDPGDITSSGGDGDDRFESGEWVSVDHDFSGDIRILLVETTDPGHILYDETVTFEDTGPREAPTIEKFEITDTSTDVDASFDVTWNASDIQGDITTVSVELINDDVVEDSATTSFNEVASTGDHTDTLENASGSGESYKIQLNVTDAAGNSAVDSTVANAGSEIGLRPPTIEQFDVADLFQGNDVTYEVTHNATDPDGDITELAVTLTHDGTGTEVDNATYAFNETGVTGETTDTLSDPTKRQSGELYQINISVKDAEGNTERDSVIDEADGDDVSTGTGADPVIDSFDVTDTSVCTQDKSASYEISWTVSDTDGNLNNVTLELISANNNNVKESSLISVSGENASGTTIVSDNGGCGKDYKIKITVKDDTGNTVGETTPTDTADGSGIT